MDLFSVVNLTGESPSIISSVSSTKEESPSTHTEASQPSLKRKGMNDEAGSSKKKSVIFSGLKLSAFKREGSTAHNPATIVADLHESSQHQESLAEKLRTEYDNDVRLLSKDDEISLLKAQLEAVRADLIAADNSRAKLADERISLLAQVSQQRSELAMHRRNCDWAIRYLQLGHEMHYANLEDFRQAILKMYEDKERRLRKLSIEFDEELYPQLMSTLAERRWLIRHGLRLAAMQVLESHELSDAFEDVVDHAVIYGKTEAILELCSSHILDRSADQVPGYNANALEELGASLKRLQGMELPIIGMIERDQDYPIKVIMEGLTLARHMAEDAESEIDYHLKPDVSQLKVPIFPNPRDILSPFTPKKEISLRSSLKAHAQRVAHKKGKKGRAVLCGIGSAHLPRSDKVPVAVGTVSPKDIEILTKLSDASAQASQPSSSRLRRSRSF